jgi:hypothetical protein
MYSYGDYFIECIPEPSHKEGWTVSAKISRRRDYRCFAPVVKIEFRTDITEISRFKAERAGVAWAKTFIAEHASELEQQLVSAGDSVRP